MIFFFLSGLLSKEFYEDMIGGWYLLKCKCEKIFDNVFVFGLMLFVVLDLILSSYIESKIGCIVSVFIFKWI